MRNQVLLAAIQGDLPKLQKLLREGVTDVNEADEHGRTALWLAIKFYKFQTAQWLLKYGGADIYFTVDDIGLYILDPFCADTAASIALLCVMLLRSDCPDFPSSCWPKTAQLVQEGAQLRTRLPAYLLQRRALLDTHCPLLPPLVSLVNGYEVPTTTEELWATRLGAAP
jgi:hypothetical protein